MRLEQCRKETVGFRAVFISVIWECIFYDEQSKNWSKAGPMRVANLLFVEIYLNYRLHLKSHLRSLELLKNLTSSRIPPANEARSAPSIIVTHVE